MKKKTSNKKSKSSKFLNVASTVFETVGKTPSNPIRQDKIPSLANFKAKIRSKRSQSGRKKMFPMPYEIKKAKKGKIMEKPLNPSVANKVVDKIIKSKKYSYVNRAMNPKTPTKNNQTLRTMGSDGKLFPTIRMVKGKLKQYKPKEAIKITKKKKDAINVTNIAPTYVSTKDVSLALSDRIGKARGAPPKKRPLPQGLRIGAISDLGCPHRENGVQGSDIQGVKPLQTKGKKFTGVK